MKLSKALEIIEGSNCRISKVEEWINKFMEGLVDDHFDSLSTLNFIRKQAIEIVLGVKKDDGFMKDEYKDLLIFYKTKWTESQLRDELKSCQKLDKFFGQFDI